MLHNVQSWHEERLLLQDQMKGLALFKEMHIGITPEFLLWVWDDSQLPSHQTL